MVAIWVAGRKVPRSLKGFGSLADYAVGIHSSSTVTPSVSASARAAKSLGWRLPASRSETNERLRPDRRATSYCDNPHRLRRYRSVSGFVSMVAAGAMRGSSYAASGHPSRLAAAMRAQRKPRGAATPRGFLSPASRAPKPASWRPSPSRPKRHGGRSSPDVPAARRRRRPT